MHLTDGTNRSRSRTPMVLRPLLRGLADGRTRIVRALPFRLGADRSDQPADSPNGSTGPAGRLAPGEAAARQRPTLRIAHFSDTYLPRRDGIITALQTLTGAMSELGHESLIVIPRHPDLPDSDELMQVPSVPIGVAQFRLASWPRTKHVERVAHWLPHVIHVHTPGPIGLLGILAARRLGLPLVQTYHTDLHAYADAYRLPARVLSTFIRASCVRLSRPTPDLPKGISGIRMKRDDRRFAVIEAGTDLLYGEADAVLVPTPAILTRCRLPVDDDRIYLAPAGVGLPPVGPTAREDFRREHGIGPDDRVVLFVGRINREKGIDLLTRAFGRVVSEVEHARLLLVGAVYEHKWVERLLDEAGIAERTISTGQLPPEEVACAYAASDVFGFPSLSETQGLVVQEAALAGVPPVLVDAALHSSGPLAGAGVLTEPEPDRLAETLIRMLTDEPYRREVAASAKALALRNSPETFADRMTAVYGQAVRRAATATRLRRKARRGPFKSRRDLIA